MSPRPTWRPRVSRSAAVTPVLAPTWVRSTTAASPIQVVSGIASTVVPPGTKWLKPSQCVNPWPGIASRLDLKGWWGSSKFVTTRTSVLQRTWGRMGSERSTMVMPATGARRNRPARSRRA